MMTDRDEGHPPSHRRHAPVRNKRIGEKHRGEVALQEAPPQTSRSAAAVDAAVTPEVPVEAEHPLDMMARGQENLGGDLSYADPAAPRYVRPSEDPQSRGRMLRDEEH